VVSGVGSGVYFRASPPLHPGISLADSAKNFACHSSCEPFEGSPTGSCTRSLNAPRIDAIARGGLTGRSGSRSVIDMTT
jgi:hypothetical protein